MAIEKIGIKNILLYVISIFMFLSMFVYLGANIFVAILMGILGFVLLPPVNKEINEKYIKENKTKNGVKIALEILLFFVILFNTPFIESKTEEKDKVADAKNNITNSQNMQNTQNKQNQSNVTQNTTNTTTNNNVSQNTVEAVAEPEKKQETAKVDTSSKSSSTSTSQSNKATKTQTKKQTTGSSSSKSTSSSAPVTNSQTVYVTPTGKRYHLISTCGGKNSTASTLNKAKARGLTPCKKCAQ